MAVMDMRRRQVARFSILSVRKGCGLGEFVDGVVRWFVQAEVDGDGECS